MNTYQYRYYIPVCVDVEYKYKIEAETEEEADEIMNKIKNGKIDVHDDRYYIESDYVCESEEYNDNSQPYLLKL